MSDLADQMDEVTSTWDGCTWEGDIKPSSSDEEDDE